MSVFAQQSKVKHNNEDRRGRKTGGESFGNNGSLEYHMGNSDRTKLHHSILFFCFVCCVCVSVICDRSREVTEGRGQFYTFAVIDNKFHFSTFNQRLLVSFVCLFFSYSFEGGVIFIDNNNNKFHIKTFRLVFCYF